MKRSLVILSIVAAILAIGLSGVIRTPSGRLDLTQLLIPGASARFANLPRAGRAYSSGEHYHPDATLFGMRWFPTSVSFAADNDTLAVSLCHVASDEYCRIALYHLSTDRWDVLPFAPDRTYRDPLVSHDGQWVVFSTAPCNEQAICDVAGYQLAKIRINGTDMSIISDSIALYPSFSWDGRKLIYWRWETHNHPRFKGRQVGGRNIYQLDWQTGKESALTNLVLMPGDDRGRAFFTPDGEQFIFTLDTYPLMLAKAPDRLKRQNAFLIGNVKDAPITEANIDTLKDIGPETGFGMPCDIDAKGRVLYIGDLMGMKLKGNPIALRIRPVAPDFWPTPEPSRREQEAKYPIATLTPEQLRRGDGAVNAIKRSVDSNTYRAGLGMGLFLRGLSEGSQDEGGFDAGDCRNGRLNRAGTTMAFITAGGTLPSNYIALAVIEEGRGLADTRLILNWPKLDLRATLPRHP